LKEPAEYNNRLKISELELPDLTSESNDRDKPTVMVTVSYAQTYTDLYLQTHGI